MGVASRRGRPAVSCSVGVGAASGGERANRGVRTPGAGGVVAGRTGGWPVSGLFGRDGPFIREQRGTGAAPTWVSLRGVTSSDPMSNTGSGSRRGRAEAARSESVRVRLSPVEAAVVGEAAGRVGMLVGAWVGQTAVDRARAQAAGDEPDEAGGSEPSSWREL